MTTAPRTRFYTAASADGFLATVDHSLDWLFPHRIDHSGPMGYQAFIAQVGAIAMGASTYAWLLQHPEQAEDGWPYRIPCWVFTHRTLDRPPGADVRFTAAPVPEVHAEMMAAAGGRDVWIVGGGDLAGQFADHHLLDEVTVCWAPVTLGAGAPLLPRRLDLRLAGSARNGDFVCATYEVLRH